MSFLKRKVLQDFPEVIKVPPQGSAEQQVQAEAPATPTQENEAAPPAEAVETTTEQSQAPSEERSLNQQTTESVSTPTEVQLSEPGESTNKVTVPPAPQTPIQEPPVVSDDLVFQRLSEKLGKPVASYEDLKPPDIDPNLKEISNWSQRTGRPLEDWVKFQKDYDGMSDMDVVREHLRLKYPGFDEAMINYKLKEYRPDEVDTEEEAMQKRMRLIQDATQGRADLNQMRLELNTPSQVNLTPQQQGELEFAKQIRDQLQQQEKAQAQYSTGLNSAIQSAGPVVCKLDEGFEYKYDFQNQKGSLQDFVTKMGHWYNEDGSSNFNAIVRDAAIIQNFDQIAQAIFQQGKAHGQDQLIKDSKNIVTEPKTETQGTASKGPVIHGFEELLQRSTGARKRPKYGFRKLKGNV